MHKVKLNGVILDAQDGELLSKLLMRYGIDHAHPCAGRGICKKCTVVINGEERLSCTYKINSDIEVSLPQGTNSAEPSLITPSYTDDTDNAILVLDIGTTTLSLALISADNGRIIRITERKNPQSAFGADIMSRILYCTENGTAAITKVLIDAINDMISELNPKRAFDLYVAANTTMLHTFFAVDCSSMGKSPYTPSFLDTKTACAKDIGINNAARVYALPSNSAFVGADLTAGLYYVGMPKKDRYNLLIDLGTNAEIILYSENGGVCTAAAAGPCFEGANISCGMTAEMGAIRAVTLLDGAVKVETVADAKAKGVCGTGLVDSIAALLKLEKIDESGLLCEPFELAEGVFVTPSDVREFQLAKSAIFSAIVTLMKIVGIGFSNIDKMYVTGGFSTKINVENATYVGLLPSELKEKCVPLGNTSLLGAAKYAFDKCNGFPFIRKIDYQDLSKNPIFANEFIMNMCFIDY